MNKYKWILIPGNLLLLLIFFNWTVFKKEHTLKEGELVLLRLSPVDPRSLMQGDYMRLNYAVTRIADSIQTSIPKQGCTVISLDSNRVAQIIRFQSTSEEVYAGEQVIKYRMNGSLLQLGAESFFFEEGQARAYERAMYGGLMIDEAGNSILVGLFNESFQLIIPPKK